VFAPISAILTAFLFASTLPNGIRLAEIPSTGDSVEITAGYTIGGLKDWFSTSAAISVLRDAYAVGGRIQTIDELDRTALRITLPKWALPMLTDRLPALFEGIPNGPESPDPSPDGFKANVEEEIRSALLGPAAAPRGYATSEAFVLVSAPVTATLRERLSSIPWRGSSTKADDQIKRLPAERTLRFTNGDAPEGGVIFASPVPGVYYRQWYLVLLLDRLIHRIVPLPVKTDLPLSVRPYYYRLELPVPSGQFPEPVEEKLLQEIQRLQFTTGTANDLTAARDAAMTYLASKSVREWFLSHDIDARREEGIQWIQSMTADDMRIAARDLLIMNRVVATWPPKTKQTAVSAEPLSSADIPAAPTDRSTAANVGRAAIMRGEDTPIPFAPHADSKLSFAAPERLISGVSLGLSTTNAVFVSGGPLKRFDHEPTGEELKEFQKYNPSRILVLTPSSSAIRVRQLWNVFQGNSAGENGIPQGRVSTGDLPALFVLKTLLDLRLIQAGWWHNTEIRIDASAGSALQIGADDEKRAQILEWIKGIASGATPEDYFAWAREIAVHRFDTEVADLQALTWERDPQGMIQDLQTISRNHVQDVARIYF
jgi:hypothetical protein